MMDYRDWTGRVFIGASLDGFIARPGGEIDWLTDPAPGPSRCGRCPGRRSPSPGQLCCW